MEPTHLRSFYHEVFKCGWYQQNTPTPVVKVGCTVAMVNFATRQNCAHVASSVRMALNLVELNYRLVQDGH